MCIRDRVYLPDIEVKAADSAVAAGGLLGRAAGTVTVKPAAGERKMCIRDRYISVATAATENNEEVQDRQNVTANVTITLTGGQDR